MRSWLPSFSVAFAALVLAGCGYPGEPLPPALNRPMRVTDLTALERGSKLFVAFAMPTKTTEDLAIRTQPDIELRVGPIGDRFVESDWVANSDRIAADAIKVENGRVEVQIPAEKYYGKTVAIGVKMHGPKGREVGWSNLEVVNVLAALPKPENLAAKDAPGGVGLEWKVPRPTAEFRVFRRLKSEKDWSFVGLADKTTYIDTTVEYGRDYEYFVQGGEKTGEKYAESELSETVGIKPVDRFAPAAPVGLAAIPGTRSIELVWDRSPEADWAFYRVYRDNALVADNVQSASFGDRDILQGAKHTYQVTSVDTAGNESPRSASIEAVLP